MKIKSFAIVAMAGALASSLTYAAATDMAAADDGMSSGSQMMQAPAADPSVQSQAMSPALSGQADMNSMDPAGVSSNTDPTASNPGATGTDDASPDTATGDDDY